MAAGSTLGPAGATGASVVAAGSEPSTSPTRPVKCVTNCSDPSASDLEATSRQSTFNPAPSSNGVTEMVKVRGSSRKNLNGAWNSTSSMAATVQPGADAEAASAKASTPITPGRTA